jgi:hypothetical protein
MPSNDLTLAFSLQALETLARPNRAFQDATTWSSNVGIVSSEPAYLERRRARDAGYQWDFLSGPRSIEEALSRLLDLFETERYVYVGTEQSSDVISRVADWSYQSVTDAAAAANWRIETPTSTADDWP